MLKLHKPTNPPLLSTLNRPRKHQIPLFIHFLPSKVSNEMTEDFLEGIAKQARSQHPPDMPSESPSFIMDDTLGGRLSPATLHTESNKAAVHGGDYTTQPSYLDQTAPKTSAPVRDETMPHQDQVSSPCTSREYQLLFRPLTPQPIRPSIPRSPPMCCMRIASTELTNSNHFVRALSCNTHQSGLIFIHLCRLMTLSRAYRLFSNSLRLWSTKTAFRSLVARLQSCCKRMLSWQICLDRSRCMTMFWR